MSVQNVGEDGDGQCLHSLHGRFINANQRAAQYWTAMFTDL